MHHQDDEDERDEQREHNGIMAKGFLAGALLGSLAGAGAALLLAPQSGKRTRAKIQHAGLELRDQTVAGVEDALEQARATGRHISAGVHKQTEDLQQRGQALLDEQKERVATIVEAGKKFAKGSAN